MIQGRKNSRSGQGLVEYVMALLLVVIVFTVMQRQINRGIGALWTTLARDIVAACPTNGGDGCEIPEQLR